MSEERCEKTDLPVGTCGGSCCRPDLAPAVELPTVVARFAASYPGRCVAGCGEPIAVGQYIVRADAGAYAHDACSGRLARAAHAPRALEALMGRLKLRSDQLVACVDGPLGGAWYYSDDWQQRRAIAERMRPVEAQPSIVLGYVPTGQYIRHRWDEDCPPAAAWRYVGIAAQQQAPAVVSA